MNRVLELLKKIWAVIRSNLGLKIVSLLFALILWNYVIAVENPTTQTTLRDLDIRINGETAMKQSNLTIKGDKSLYFKPVDVTLLVSRKEQPLLKPTDVTVTVDLSNITRDGTQKVQIRATTIRGSMVRVEPDTITLNVERLRTKVVPVEVVPVGKLPDGYWNSTPQIRPDTLEITGALTDIQAVDRAVVEVSLDNLTGNISRPIAYTLQDINGAVVAMGNMTADSPNCIVDLQVLPTKTVPVSVRAEDILTGDLPEGYELSGVTADPAEIVVAGPASALADLVAIPAARINVTDKKSSFSEYKSFQLPPNVRAVGATGANVTVGIRMKTVTSTLENLPVTVTGLGSGLTTDDKLTVSAMVTLPELYYSRLRISRVHLIVDVTGLGAGQHTLDIRAETDPALGEATVLPMPAQVTVNIRSEIQQTSIIGGQP